jgi:endonuclease/exonuclease/phosphatase family metal-dependent hydrolase
MVRFARPQVRELRVVTINTGKCDGAYRARLGWLADELCRLDPDIVACQEAFLAEDGSADTAGELARWLGLYLITAPARFKQRVCEGRQLAGWSGLALLGRRPWLEPRVIPLPSDERDGERVALIARAVYDGREVVVANVHLTHLRDVDTLRGTQLDHVLRQPQLARDGAVRLLCGDFNTSADGPVLAPRLASVEGCSLRDAYAAGGGRAPRGTLIPAGGRPAACGPCIDFILSVADHDGAHPGFRDARVVLNRAHPQSGLYPSDHAGVAVTVPLDGRGPAASMSS